MFIIRHPSSHRKSSRHSTVNLVTGTKGFIDIKDWRTLSHEWLNRKQDPPDVRCTKGCSFNSSGNPGPLTTAILGQPSGRACPNLTFCLL